MALLDDLFSDGKKPSDQGPTNPHWVTDAHGRFYRLVDLDPEKEGLTGTSAVFVIWHKGVKPSWVFVGKTRDLANALYDTGRNDDVMRNNIHGGLFVTWSLIRNEFQDGVVRYLTEVMQPKVNNPAASHSAKPIPVLIPGVKS